MRDGTAAAFGFYLGAVEACFVETERGVELPGDGLDFDRTTVVLDASEALGDAIAGEASVLEDPGLETATLAAVALDLVVGVELLRIESENGIFAPAGASAQEVAPRPQDLESLAEILEDARRAFPQQMPGGMSGAALPPRDPLGIVQAAMAELLDSAAEPAGKFAIGLFAAGLAQGSDVLVHLANLPNPFHLPGGGHGLIRRGVRKLLSIVDYEVLRGALSEFQFDILTEGFVEGQHPSLSAQALNVVVRAPGCQRAIVKLFRRRTVDAGKLEVELESLRLRHVTNMCWGRRTASAMTWGGPLVIVASGGPPGVIGMAGARLLGLAVVVYLLADRLDTLPKRLDLIDGVQKISAECVLP
jgi:hypothetical protein